MAATHPAITAAVVVVLVILAVIVIWKLFGYLKLVGDRLRRWRAGSTSPPGYS
jgi:hypothetical protein